MTHKLSKDEAEEIVQDTWSDFFAQIERFEGRSHIRTYLIGILYNKVKEHIRKKQRVHLSDNQNDDLQADESSNHWQAQPVTPDRRLGFKQSLESLQTALDQLPPKQKMALYLKEVESESTEHICKAMDISKENLGVLIFRAKKNLRAHMYIPPQKQASAKEEHTIIPTPPAISYKELFTEH